MTAKKESKRARKDAMRKAAGRRQRMRRLLAASVFAAVVGGIAAAVPLLTGGTETTPQALSTIPPDADPGPSAVQVGQPFPAFQVTDVDGRVVTTDSLKGRPAILWYTTTYCVPCQVGARAVAELDDKLGGDAFDVLVLFVDPGETTQALRDWRDQFARPDWMLALDGDGTLSALVGLRFLDSKFLLDEEGVLTNIDFATAGETYLSLIREVVGRTGA